MEFEQIGKRLEWLDEQQRKNKGDLSDLGGRLTYIETSVNALMQQFKTVNQGKGYRPARTGGYQTPSHGIGRAEKIDHCDRQDDRSRGYI